jgi:hypothetical protein
MNYEDIASKATITPGEQPPILKTDSKEIKELKKVPLWYFDFSKVDDTPISFMGEHAPTPEEAIPLVAERLRALYPSN